jgi:periplasmic divalent cation tolerance protein
MKDAVVVVVTVPTPDAGADLARALVEEGLAACGNVVPGLRSIYRWAGEIHDEAEALLLLKTERRLVTAMKERLPALHPYQVPELLVLPVEDGLGPYLDWIAKSRPDHFFLNSASSASRGFSSGFGASPKSAPSRSRAAWEEPRRRDAPSPSWYRSQALEAILST